jgi:hypothetical protein
MTEKSRRVAATSPARNEAHNNTVPTGSLAPRLSQALPRATFFRAARAPLALRPPPFNPAAVLRAALMRAGRLGKWDQAAVRRLTERCEQGWSAPESAALVRIADTLNLGAGDRG